MMRISILLVVLVYFTAIPGCKTNNFTEPMRSFTEKDFKQTKTIEGRSFPIGAVNKPVSMRVIPAYNLVILLASTAEHFLAKAYTLDSFKLIREFAPHGRQPDHQLNAWSLRYNMGSRNIYITDVVKNGIYCYSLDSILSGSATCKPVRVLVLSDSNTNELSLGKPVIFPDEKTILDFRDNSEKAEVGMFNFYDSAGNFRKFAAHYPKIKDEYPAYALNDVFTAGMNLSENGSKIICNYYNADIIDLFDSSGKLLNRVWGPSADISEFQIQQVGGGVKVVPGDKAHFAYTGQARMNDNRIFVLYSGKMMSTGEYHADTFFEFDQNLDPVTLYHLKTPIFEFDIDWNNRKIYGLSHQDHNQIVVYTF